MHPETLQCAGARPAATQKGFPPPRTTASHYPCQPSRWWLMKLAASIQTLSKTDGEQFLCQLAPLTSSWRRGESARLGGSSLATSGRRVNAAWPVVRLVVRRWRQQSHWQTGQPERLLERQPRRPAPKRRQRQILLVPLPQQGLFPTATANLRTRHMPLRLYPQQIHWGLPGDATTRKVCPDRGIQGSGVHSHLLNVGQACRWVHPRLRRVANELVRGTCQTS